MVDTDMLSRAFREGGLKAVPKLRTEDVMAAVRFALETPPHVQVRGRGRRIRRSGGFNLPNGVDVDWKFRAGERHHPGGCLGRWARRREQLN